MEKMWDRRLQILKYRWSLMDSEDAIENKKAEFKWQYSKKMKRMVRVYNTSWRLCVKFVGYPVLMLLVLMSIGIFLWIAVSGGNLYQMPRCDDCRYMLNWRNQSEFFQTFSQRNPSNVSGYIKFPMKPYDEYNLVARHSRNVECNEKTRICHGPLHSPMA